MISEFEQNLAKLVVNFSIQVQPGQLIGIEGNEYARDLILAIYAEVLKAGGNIIPRISLSGTEETFVNGASDEQLAYLSPVNFSYIENIDARIVIDSPHNTRNLQLCDPSKIKKIHTSSLRKKYIEIYNQREETGGLKWILLPYPTEAMAQDAGMDLFNYKKFVSKALFLDQPFPVKAWEEIRSNQDKIIEYLNNTKIIHVIGQDTDLTLNVEGRKWVNCFGDKNLPDGEIFTSPIENDINGRIRFTFPGIFMGKEIENIYLEIQDGKVKKASADRGEELLKEILSIEGADMFGEFAIGTNYGIDRFSKNMLFDEKMGGTLHMALGMGFPEAGGKADCTIHWDILKDMKPDESVIYADDKPIYRAGKWLIP